MVTGEMLLKLGLPSEEKRGDMGVSAMGGMERRGRFDGGGGILSVGTYLAIRFRRVI